jgi:hypothetical protein
MNLAARFTAYATDFERSYADRDWARLGPYFAGDAVYECRAPEMLAFRVVGRAAILERFATVTEVFDRRFDSRSMSFEPAVVDGQRVSITGLVVYALSGAPDFRLPFSEVAEYRGTEIVHLEDASSPEALSELCGKRQCRANVRLRTLCRPGRAKRPVGVAINQRAGRQGTAAGAEQR